MKSKTFSLLRVLGGLSIKTAKAQHSGGGRGKDLSQSLSAWQRIVNFSLYRNLRACPESFLDSGFVIPAFAGVTELKDLLDALLKETSNS